MGEAGEPEGAIDAMAAPAPYDDWLFGAFFPVNMRFLYQRHLRVQRAGGTLVGL